MPCIQSYIQSYWAVALPEHNFHFQSLSEAVLLQLHFFNLHGVIMKFISVLLSKNNIEDVMETNIHPKDLNGCLQELIFKYNLPASRLHFWSFQYKIYFPKRIFCSGK